MRTIAEMEHSGIVAMIEDHKIDDLARAYDLFKRVTQPQSGLGVIRELMAANVKRVGTELVNDEERNRDPVLYVQGLLQLRDKYDKVIVQAFQSDKQFYNSLNQVQPPCKRRPGWDEGRVSCGWEATGAEKLPALSSE